MWQRFTERARRAILLAQEEAAKGHSQDVDPGHFLLGLIRVEEGAGGRLLKQRGVTYDAVQQKLYIVLPKPKEAFQGEPKLTPQAKRVLELSADEARRMQHNYVGSEHLLLALLREKRGQAFPILREYELELDDLRARVKQLLEEDIVAAEAAKEESEALAAELDQTIKEMLAEFSEMADESFGEPATPETRMLMIGASMIADYQAAASKPANTARPDISHLLLILLGCEGHWFRKLLTEQGIDIELLQEQVKQQSVRRNSTDFRNGILFLMKAAEIARNIALQRGDSSQLRELNSTLERLRYLHDKHKSGEDRAEESD